MAAKETPTLLLFKPQYKALANICGFYYYQDGLNLERYLKKYDIIPYTFNLIHETDINEWSVFESDKLAPKIMYQGNFDITPLIRNKLVFYNLAEYITENSMEMIGHCTWLKWQQKHVVHKNFRLYEMYR